MIIEVQLRKDPTFKRRGADLYMEKEISLFEALSGTQFTFHHLDQRKVHVSTPMGKILGHAEVMCVEDLGMPFFGRSFKYGNLFVTFSVTFPASLTKGQVSAVRDALHSKEAAAARHDPSVKPEHKLKHYQGTEQELLARLRKRCTD